MSRRVLLDEGVPRHLAGVIEAAGFPTSAYPNQWKQMKNGELLWRAQAEGFDVLVTNDKNIYAQQNLRGLTLAIVVLPTNLRRHIMARADDVADTVRRIEAGQYVVIEPEGQRQGIDYRTNPPRAVEMPSVGPFKTK